MLSLRLLTAVRVAGGCGGGGVLGSAGAPAPTFAAAASDAGRRQRRWLSMPLAHQGEYQRWKEDPAQFWQQEALKRLRWTRAPSQVLTGEPPFQRWFADGQLSVYENLVLANAQSQPNTIALQHFSAYRRQQPLQQQQQQQRQQPSPHRGEDLMAAEVARRRASLAATTAVATTLHETTLTYGELHERASRMAAVLRYRGVQPGDTVVIYMAAVPETVVAIAAVAHVGAVACVVFGGFAAHELARRIRDVKPRLVLASAGGIEPRGVIDFVPIVRSAISECVDALGPQRPPTLVVQRPADMPLAPLSPSHAEFDYAADEDTVLCGTDATAALRQPPAVRAATDPLYVLYTSGTTGKPKGIVRDCASLVGIAYAMDRVYGVGRAEPWFCTADPGWVVGHNAGVYGPLAVGATSVMYEGKPVGTPDAGAYWAVAARSKAVGLFSAPTALRAIRGADPEGRLVPRLPSLRHIVLAGERCDPATNEWAARVLDVPVVDVWWMTETGMPHTGLLTGIVPARSLPPAQRPSAGSAGWPTPGFDVVVEPVEDDQAAVAAATAATDAATANAAGHRSPEQHGRLLMRMPLPPNGLATLWPNDNQRMQKEYFERDRFGQWWFVTGDVGSINAAGEISVMARTDDVIKVAGHRLSTGELESTLIDGAPYVAEAAVVPRRDAVKGAVPVAFVVLKAGAADDPATPRTPQLIEQALVAAVRRSFGPVAAMHNVRVVARLPKTRSGKTLRRTLREIVNGDAVNVPPTIEDIAVVDEIRAVILSRPLSP